MSGWREDERGPVWVTSAIRGSSLQWRGGSCRVSIPWDRRPLSRHTASGPNLNPPPQKMLIWLLKFILFLVVKVLSECVFYCMYMQKACPIRWFVRAQIITKLWFLKSRRVSTQDSSIIGWCPKVLHCRAGHAYIFKFVPTLFGIASKLRLSELRLTYSWTIHHAPNVLPIEGLD